MGDPDQLAGGAEGTAISVADGSNDTTRTDQVPVLGRALMHEHIQVA